MKYRPEIDGLRAFAVLPVIFFHAGVTVFSGGFVGVDVFFVISGYLITTIIIDELADGRFSILRFYERRARRILPALFFVLLTILPFAWLWMLPSQFENFMQAMIAVCLFVSNVFFWSETGYFDQAAELKPLLHTWSLAVEEQYYLFFPVMLALLWRLGRRVVFAVVVLIAAASFGWSLWAARATPDAAFFLLPARAWELFAGSICAFWMARRAPDGQGILAAVGLAMVVAGIFVLNEHHPWPSYPTLLPVIGTMLVILFARPQNWAGQVLALSPVVGIGLISYSAYLWHQPLFALARIRSIEPPSLPLMLGLAVLSLVLAWFSWRYVEAPFRRRPTPVLPRQKQVFRASGLAMAAFMLFGLTFALRPDWRVGSLVQVDATLIDPVAARDASWDLLWSGAVDHFPPEDGRKRLLIVGDSHSKDIFNAINLNADAWPSMVVRRAELVPGCLRVEAIAAGRLPADCILGNDAGATDLYIEATHVLISRRWQVSSLPLIEGLPAFVRAMEADGKIVSVASTSPEYTPESPQMLRRLAADAQLAKAAVDKHFFSKLDPAVADRNKLLADAAQAADVPFLPKVDYICDAQALSCAALTDAGEAIYYDYGHYTLPGAKYLGARMAAMGWLEPALRDR